MQALKSVMQNPNEVPEPRESDWLRRMILMLSFWSGVFCQILKSRKGRLVRIRISRPVCTPLVLCMMLEGKEVDRPKEKAVGVLEGTGNPLRSLSFCIACTEPKENNLLLMLPRVCLSLWESDGRYFLQSFGTNIPLLSKQCILVNTALCLENRNVHSLYSNPEAQGCSQLLCVG